MAPLGLEEVLRGLGETAGSREGGFGN